MIDTVEQQRHIVGILLPRVEDLAQHLAADGVDVRETMRRLLEGEGRPQNLKWLAVLRTTLTVCGGEYENVAVVEAAIRESFDLVLALR
jgi:hypothetical protein